MSPGGKMTYFDLESAFCCAREIAATHPSTSNPPQDDWEKNRETLIWQSNTERATDKKLQIALFAQSLINVMLYLRDKHRKKPDKTPQERIEFINSYVGHLVRDCKSNNLYKLIQLPTAVESIEAMNQSFHRIHIPSYIQIPKRPGFFDRLANGFNTVIANTAAPLIREQAVKDFLNGKAFKALKSYLNLTLKHDVRKHTFLFGCIDFSEPKKAKYLEKFIIKIEAKMTMAEIQDEFRALYAEKGMVFAHKNKDGYRSSYYDTFNQGQNITTRLLSFFGCKTTTANLIDNCARTIHVDTNNIAPHID